MLICIIIKLINYAIEYLGWIKAVFEICGNVVNPNLLDEIKIGLNFVALWNIMLFIFWLLIIDFLYKI
jgi:hypothetical protein